MTTSCRGSIGQGATFWVTMRFPRQAAPVADPELGRQHLGTRVLVVDDNETSRQFLHQQLIARRLRGGHSGTGNEAMAMLRQAAARHAPYHFAIVDLQRTDAAGLAMVRRINAEPLLAETRIILLTLFGSAIPGDELEALNIAGCCAKPVPPSALFDCLHQGSRR